MSERRYRMEFSAEQANVLQDACDCYMRLLLGQLGYVADYAVKQSGFERGMQLKNAMEELNTLVTGYTSRHASPGIFNESLHEDAKVAHDFYSAVRHKLSWDAHPEGGSGVNFHEPMQAAKERLPIIDGLPPLTEMEEGK